MDILSNASGVTSHLLMGRLRATEMNLSRDRCHPSAFKKEECERPCCFLFLVMSTSFRGVGFTHIIRWQGRVPHLY